jgi:O-antigen/teichoic acid export membrane protein
MPKQEKLQVVKNVSSSWLAVTVNVSVGIFLSPIVLHHLGDSAFGIWVLIFSITGYYGLFDLGIRASVVRYVSKFVATKDDVALNKLVNTSLFTYSCIGAITLAATLILVPYVDTLFRIPPEFHSTAQWLLIMVGASVALGFPLGVTGGVLEGLQRFDIVNSTSIAATLARALLTVVVLRRGGGLLSLAWITVTVPLIVSLIRGVMVRRICALRLAWRYVNRETFRQMAGYSGITFMIILASRLKFKTDEIIIGSMMSAAAITYFNVGARIVDYAGDAVIGLAQIFMPMSSHTEATGDMDGLQRILILGNRFCALAMFPICVTLIMLGQSIIEVWVGRKYVALGYPVLVILILATTMLWAQGASTRVLAGIGKHGTWAVVTLLEGISNVLLSVILVRPYGIIGDSLGTAIPMFCTMIFFIPRHTCRRLGIRISTYLQGAYALPLLLCGPMVLTIALMKTWFVPHTYGQLAIHLLVCGGVYGAGLAWAHTTNRLTSFSRPKMESATLDVATAAIAADNSL